MSKVKPIRSPARIKVEDYTAFNDIEHVYERPQMYGINTDKMFREEWLYDSDQNHMKYREVEFPPGVDHIFREIMDNASDHVIKSRKEGEKCDLIEIKMTDKIISVKNGGLSLPIEKVPQIDIYLPEQIFGRLRTTSHHKEADRQSIGVNGIGSKATNIFSKRFYIIVENHEVGKRYTQVWTNNMMTCNPPKIEKFKGSLSSVYVEYELDFKKFNMECYPKEAYELFARHASDMSFNTHISVLFNDKTFNYTDIKEFACLYLGDFEHFIIHKQHNLELIAIDTPDEGRHISFVNSKMTADGGVHVNAAYKAICEPLMNTINDNMLRKLAKGTYYQSDIKSNTINMGDVKPHISLILSCQLNNPDHTGNNKSYLVKPTPKIDIDDNILRPMIKWSLVKRLNDTLESKQKLNLSKTDGKMSKHVDINIDGFIDANNAGKKGKAKDCVLVISEGKSGSNYINTYIALIEDGRNFYGTLPFRGKCLNVMAAQTTQITQNREISALKEALGLKENTDYTDPENFSKLRYGKLLCAQDSDIDGKHILGLIMNIFYCRFPSLLKVEGFFGYMRTPIIRMFKGKKMVKKFYTQREYNLWAEKNADTSLKANYFKGLGSSTDEDVADDKKNEQIVTCLFDEDATKALTLAFNDTQVYRDLRKEWIINWVERSDVDTMIRQPISLFINHEFILFSKQNLIRAIPKLLDGFKESYRKVMAGAHKKFNIGPLNQTYEKQNVSDFDAFVKGELRYHHGPDILSKVIVHMAQNYIGSNNLNLFVPSGQFGSRIESGKAAAARYLHTFPAALTSYLYIDDDQDLLKPMTDEGKLIEPETYLPILPNILCNGIKGIGSGFSTYIPCHNPLDIISWLKLRLTGHITLPNIKPWYRGFKGEIKIISRNDKEYDENNVIYDNDEVGAKNIYLSTESRPMLSFITYGKYFIKNNTIIITELPIGLYPAYYLENYVKKFLTNKIIKDYANKCNKDDIYFELIGFTGNPTFITLGLQRQFSLSNMVLLDKDNKPVRYSTANDIIETFYNERLPYYHERKRFKLNKIKCSINTLNEKMNFIIAILNKSLIVENRPKHQIYDELKKLKISESVYDNAKISNLNKEEVELLKIKIQNCEEQYEELNKLSASDLWLHDLKLFENKYKTIYK